MSKPDPRLNYTDASQFVYTPAEEAPPDATEDFARRMAERAARMERETLRPNKSVKVRR